MDQTETLPRPPNVRPDRSEAMQADALEHKQNVSRRKALGFLGAGLLTIGGVLKLDHDQTEKQQTAAVSATPTLIPTQKPVPTPERLPTNTPIAFTKRSYFVAPNDTVPEPQLDPRAAATSTAIALEKKP